MNLLTIGGIFIGLALGIFFLVEYQDNGNNGKAAVMKFDGTTWKTVGSAGFSEDEASNPTLSFKDGLPYMTYAKQRHVYEAYTKRFDGKIGSPSARPVSPPKNSNAWPPVSTIVFPRSPMRTPTMNKKRSS